VARAPEAAGDLNSWAGPSWHTRRARTRRSPAGSILTPRDRPANASRLRRRVVETRCAGCRLADVFHKRLAETASERHRSPDSGTLAGPLPCREGSACARAQPPEAEPASRARSFRSSVHGPSRGTRRKRWTDTRRGFRLPIGRRSEELQANLQANWFHAWLRRKAPGNTRYGNRWQAAWTLGSEEVSTAGFYCEPARGSPSSLAVRPGRPSACRRSSSSASARRRSSSLWTAPRTIAESVLPGLEGAFQAPNSAGVRRTGRASDRRNP
jgi:hypothetical protein